MVGRQGALQNGGKTGCSAEWWEDRVLCRILDSKREEKSGGRRKLY
jgi:hypothetical protein